MDRQPKPTAISKRPSLFRPTLELLEDRRLMATGISAALTSAGVLTITGTGKADIIILKQEAKIISVFDDTKIVGNFNVGTGSRQAKSLVVNAQGGNDYVKLFGNSFNPVRIPATIKGGEGNDTLWGGAAADKIYGENGSDNLFGNDGIDYLFGGDGNDTLEGGNQGDFLYGGKDNDNLRGGPGADYLFGEDGNDYLNGGMGSKDNLDGGRGTDTFRLNMYLPSNGFSLKKDEDDEQGDMPAEVAGAFLINPTSDDLYAINQEGTPTCSFLAALAAAAQWTGKFPQYGSANNDLLSRITYNSGNDEYGVKLFVNNRWATVWVNSDWTEGKDPNSPLWVTLYQKAFLKVMDVNYKVNGSVLPVEQWKSASGKNWKDAGIAMEMLTTDKSNWISSGNLNPQDMQTAMGKGWLYTASSKDNFVSSPFVSDHAYAVQQVFKQNGEWMVRLYNPWGHDRKGNSLDGKDEGSISVTWAQFKANVSGVHKN